ncbi:MAG: AAA family ATPase [Blastocatellia bacterium]|nr:AAA family ATPase [Blastocatellia bacterium]
MRISHIIVKKLFGVFDHTIPLNMDDRITIIHGPNGFGKTAILRLIDGLFNSNYSELRTIPFEEFRVVFDDESVLKVVQTNGHKHEEAFRKPLPGIKISYKKSNEKEKRFGLSFDEEERSNSSLMSFGDALRAKIKLRNPTWFEAIRQAINVRFIQTQRLLTLSTSQEAPYYRIGPSNTVIFESSIAPSPSMISVVVEYSAELAKVIQSKLREYASLSQSLDRTFPARLVKEEVPPDLTAEDLRSQLSALEERRNELTDAGLLDKEGSGDFQIPETIDDDRTKGVLSVYIKDVQKKLSVFDEMAAKIDLFKRVINERFKYKEMTISKDSGITFTTYDGVPLSPDNLSSGEQHELVLLYEFLFNVKPNSLILIDEPEISLHIVWQQQFLQDLQQITDLAFFDVLIATHSPQIIYDRWDLTVELKGPAEGGRNQQSDELEPVTATASVASTD